MSKKNNPRAIAFYFGLLMIAIEFFLVLYSIFFDSSLLTQFPEVIAGELETNVIWGYAIEIFLLIVLFLVSLKVVSYGP